MLIYSVLLAAMATALAMEDDISHGNSKTERMENTGNGDTNEYVLGIILEMDRKINQLTSKVKQQDRKIVEMEKHMDEMDRTIQKQTKEIDELVMEIKVLNDSVISQVLKLEETERELRKQRVAINNLEKENDKCKTTTNLGQENANEYFDWEKLAAENLANKTEKLKVTTDLGDENRNGYFDVSKLTAAGHNTKGDELGHHANRNGNVIGETSVSSMRRKMSNKQRDSIVHKTVAASKASDMKRFLSPSALPQTETNVAFSAYLNHSIDNMSLGYTIKMDGIHLNDGNAYSTQTGFFTVPRSGVYLLTYTIYDYQVDHKLEVELVVDKVSMGSAKAEAIGVDHQVEATKVLLLRLNAGQAVWLQTYYDAGSSIYSGPINNFSTFSGVLLYG